MYATFVDGEIERKLFLFQQQKKFKFETELSLKLYAYIEKKTTYCAVLCNFTSISVMAKKRVFSFAFEWVEIKKY